MNPHAKSTSKSGRLPPQPSCSALEQTYLFVRDPLALIARCVRERGDLFSLRLLGLGNWVFACAPDCVEQVARAPADELVTGEVNRDTLGALTGVTSAFALDGDAHRARRRILNPIFTEARVSGCAAVIRRIVEGSASTWPRGAPFALFDRTHEIAFEVMLETVLGVSGRDGSSDLAKRVYRLATEGVSSPLVMTPRLQIDLGPRSPWGRVKRIQAEAMEAITREIERRFARGEFESRGDVLSKLLQVHAREPAEMPFGTIADEVVALLIAGFDTTGTVMAWTIERAVSHPAVLERLLAEIDRDAEGNDEGSGRAPTLPYLDAVVNESVRTRPLLPFAGVRRVKRPFALRDYVIPEGDTVVLGLYGLGLQEGLFPEPHVFRPERFLERKFSAFEWCPFGGGPRLCVGRALAMVELKVALAALLRRFRFRVVDAPVGIARKGIFLVPRGGLRVVVTER